MFCCFGKKDEPYHTFHQVHNQTNDTTFIYNLPSKKQACFDQVATLIKYAAIITVTAMGVLSLIGGVLSPYVIGGVTIGASGLCIFAVSNKNNQLTSSEMFAYLTTFALGILLTQNMINLSTFGGISIGVHGLSIIFNDLYKKCSEEKVKEQPHLPTYSYPSSFSTDRPPENPEYTSYNLNQGQVTESFKNPVTTAKSPTSTTKKGSLERKPTEYKGMPSHLPDPQKTTD